jgi:hypothetical protein
MVEIKKDFLTYKSFKNAMERYPGFIYLFDSSRLRVSLKFDRDVATENDAIQSNVKLVKPVASAELLSVSVIKAFDLQAPFGFRLIQARRVLGFNDVSDLVIRLSNTPIYLRGDING